MKTEQVNTPTSAERKFRSKYSYLFFLSADGLGKVASSTRRRSMERTRNSVTSQLARGGLVIHSAPSALIRHVEWSVQSLLGENLKLEWKSQPLLPGTFRTSIDWRNTFGLGAKLASALRGWHYLRFEVREESTASADLYRFTPELGIHHAGLDQTGSVIISEHQVVAALNKNFDEDSIRSALENILGKPWDTELEAFRLVDQHESQRLKAI